MTGHTPDALASALPADDYGRLTPKDAKELAHIQAERLAESGYVLLHPESVDEATVERLAPAVHDAYLETCDRLGWSVRPENAVPYAELSDDSQELDRATVRAVLRTLAGTSAQARHADGDATGGGEHG